MGQIIAPENGTVTITRNSSNDSNIIQLVLDPRYIIVNNTDVIYKGYNQQGQELTKSERFSTSLVNTRASRAYRKTYSDSEFPFSLEYGDFIVSATTEQVWTTVNNIPHTVLTLEWVSTSACKFILTCEDGYKFEAAPIRHIQSNNTDSVMNLSADGKQATANNVGVTDRGTNTYTFTGEVVSTGEPTGYNIDNTIEHTNYTLDGDVLTVTADDGYVFEDAPTAGTPAAPPISQIYATFSLSDDGETATINLSDEGFSKEFTIEVTGDVVAKSEPVDDVINEIEHTTYTVEGDIVTISADDGYIFEDAPTIDNFSTASPPIHQQSITCDLSADGKTATGDISVFGQYLPVTLKGVAVPDSTYTGFYGSVNVYDVTNNNLKDFASMRFMTDGTDVGRFVCKLFRIFCPIGETLAAVITCGNYNTHISAQTPTTDRQLLNFGEVTVPFHNNNLIDYNSKIKMFLPFIGFVSVDTAYIGKPVNLTYEINVITGEGVARLSCNGVVFAVYDCKPSTEILYKTSNVNTVGELTFNSAYLYGLNPYVTVEWNNSKNEYTHNPDCVRTVIGSVIGFARITECTDINAEQMTADEKTMIINLLSSGVNVEQQS